MESKVYSRETNQSTVFDILLDRVNNKRAFFLPRPCLSFSLCRKVANLQWPFWGNIPLIGFDGACWESNVLLWSYNRKTDIWLIDRSRFFELEISMIGMSRPKTNKSIARFTQKTFWPLWPTSYSNKKHKLRPFWFFSALEPPLVFFCLVLIDSNVPVDHLLEGVRIL